MPFYNGLDELLDSAEVMADFENYFSFAEAARMIDFGWSTNYLHKQKVVGRLDKTKIVYVIDLKMKLLYASTGGKKMFLHKSEIERFKREEYPKIKKRPSKNSETYCTWCRAPIYDCNVKPCYDRAQRLILERAKMIGDKTELIKLSSESELTIKIKESKRGKFKR